MPIITFEWDPVKAERNTRRHRVTFEEATSAFDDHLAYIIADETHSSDEPRELLVGHSRRNRLLLVVFTERDANTIRIISARLANGKERKRYEQERRF